MWDCNGLEAAVNVDDIQRQRTWAVLQGKSGREVPASPSLMHWELRARANPQRHYEIYIISVEDGITVDDIVAAFEDNPQGMADTVRRIGHKFYSDRATEEVRIR
jgi:SH3-like domain-containing protein